MKMICIMCPVGCELEVIKTKDKVTVTGNACPRGVIFGEKEITNPERMVTTIKQYKTGTISLKTSNPVSKKLVAGVLKEIKNTKPPENIKTGDVYIKNVLQTGQDVIVTGINK